MYSFEANPIFYDLIRETGTKLIPKAVWIEDTQKNFYVVSKNKNGKANKISGSSTLSEQKNKWNLTVGNHQESESILVDCVDFSNWLHNTLYADDYVILKMDIEGSEYEVLNKMIETGAIKYINELWAEFHWAKCGVSESAHNNLLAKLKTLVDVVDDSWDAQEYSKILRRSDLRFADEN